MEIRDILHGAIHVSKAELKIVDSPYFQRLRQIKQLGFGELSFPSATHNRYIHSLGAMQTATLAFDTIFGGPLARGLSLGSDEGILFRKDPEMHQKLRQVLRLAALLHDIGHGPLSHTTEAAMPVVKELLSGGDFQEIYRGKNIDRQATHEDYTLKILYDSNLRLAIEAMGLKPEHIACLIDSEIKLDSPFFIGKNGVDYRPVLQQLISSELDADRMDYLRRDSLNSGVSYGHFDFDWLLGNLTSYTHNNRVYLALQHRALYAFEDFLISRFHMFLMVYLHSRNVVYDEMLVRYLKECPNEFRLPAKIEEYVKSNDAQLMSVLEKSKNEWAKRIIDKNPYRMLIELHSGIPAGKEAFVSQEKLFSQLLQQIKDENINFMVTESTSELSKYFKKPGNSIYVRYDNHWSEPSFIEIEKCTDLYTRYQEKRSIKRLYIDPEKIKAFKEKRK